MKLVEEATKLVALIEAIRALPRANADSLAQQLGVTERTIRHWIKYLNNELAAGITRKSADADGHPFRDSQYEVPEDFDLWEALKQNTTEVAGSTK